MVEVRFSLLRVGGPVSMRLLPTKAVSKRCGQASPPTREVGGAAVKYSREHGSVKVQTAVVGDK